MGYILTLVLIANISFILGLLLANNKNYERDDCITNTDYFSVITFAEAKENAKEQGRECKCYTDVSENTLGVALWDKDDIIKFYPVRYGDEFIKK